MIGRWLRDGRLWAVATMVIVAALLPASTVAASTLIYDAPADSRVDTRAFAASAVGLSQLKGAQEASASLSVECRGTSTTPFVLGTATNTADDLAGAASRAASNVGSGSGSVYGTRVHTAFADEVAALGRSDLFSEVSYLNGQVVPYGTPGSVRFDVVVGSPGAPTAIWDLKTGSAVLTPSRIAQIQSHLPPGFQNVPVLEVRP
jgi:hypothetical protein